jgi:tRNA G18 (ribose-2'-O)-methylase SpoU
VLARFRRRELLRIYLHDARRRAARLVALRIAPGVESLNVAVAAGVLLYQLRA